MKEPQKTNLLVVLAVAFAVVGVGVALLSERKKLKSDIALVKTGLDNIAAQDRKQKQEFFDKLALLREEIEGLRGFMEGMYDENRKAMETLQSVPASEGSESLPNANGSGRHISPADRERIIAEENQRIRAEEERIAENQRIRAKEFRTTLDEAGLEELNERTERLLEMGFYSSLRRMPEAEREQLLETIEPQMDFIRSKAEENVLSIMMSERNDPRFFESMKEWNRIKNRYHPPQH
ncbi:MAG: hypothetical protein M2R45_03454 [Verrucomicrobia subdivision 3 bacterium]|nr:hypothetical protein [Limisphaerales bacterium]MCS1415729.1 hypothetical protein [Limisphaerales bacterium]